MIKIEGIRKGFGGVVALRDVSLEVRAGKVHGLLGENGAGKSTLMNVLFGLVRPDAGRILLDGKAVVISSPRVAQRLGIGMVHQHFKLAPALTVLEKHLPGGAAGRGIHRRRWAMRQRLGRGGGKIALENRRGRTCGSSFGGAAAKSGDY